MEEKKKTYHVAAFVGYEEISHTCTCSRIHATGIVDYLLGNSKITSVTFDEVIDNECSC